NGMPLSDLLQELLSETKYFEYLDENPESAEDRKNNINELSSMFIKYQEEDEEFELSDFLEDVALVSDIDSYNEDDDAVVMMTLHSAKGLEFPIVYIPGMEEGIFPGNQSLYSEEDLEEERRLAYVGVTRAKEKLYLINARQRMLYGTTNRNMASRFLREIPAEVTDDVTVAPFSPIGSFTRAAAHTQNSSVSHKFGQVSAVKSEKSADYNVGDTVRHKTFGTGVIISAAPMGGDLLLEIAFE
ncbi:MAG: ATP-binding domain-containing protein, partial [Clostridiales bacterium]|nr:ATP-binding domain-containing protein [Clostridiales bacterium]